jgi:multidrug resistance protein
VIWTAVAVDLVGFGIVLPILPLYARRYHSSAFSAAMLVAVFSAASFVCSPLWGRLSDRIGRKPVLMVSLAGTAVASLVTGLAGSLAVLYVGRIIDGASGASVSVAQASVSDLARPEDRARLFGLLGAAFGIGFVAGPAIGALAAIAGPRAPFLVAAAIATVNAVVGLRRLPETHRPGPSPSPIPSPAGPAAPRFSWLQRWRAAAPFLVVAFCALMAFSAFEATFALFGARHLGLGIGSSAAVFAVVGLVLVGVEAGLVRPIEARLGDRVTLIAGLAANAAGLVLLAASTSWALAAPALGLLTVGQGLVQPMMAVALVNHSDRRHRGELLGAQQSAGGLGRIVGPAIGGALLGASASGAPYAFAAAVTAGAIAVAIAWWPGRLPGAPFAPGERPGRGVTV